VLFRDIKQQLGFADSSARKQAAVERVAPFVAFAYTLLVLWFADTIWSTPLAEPPIRPWYSGTSTTRASPTYCARLSACSYVSTFWIRLVVTLTYATSRDPCVSPLLHRLLPPRRL
jgi:hypothetical protein